MHSKTSKPSSEPDELLQEEKTSFRTTITTEAPSPVIKPSDDAAYKLEADGRHPTKKNKFDKTSDVRIFFEGLACCRTIVRHISLGDDMDEIRFLERVRDRFHLSCGGAETKIELTSETTQNVEWTISRKQGDGTGWPDYRKRLFEQKNGTEIYDGEYSVVSCSDLYSISCGGKHGLKSSCSREGEHRERRDDKERGRRARRRRGLWQQSRGR
jgi:hypothetical protein